MTVLYLYALVDGEPSGPLGEGLAGEPLRLVRQRAVVGDLKEPPRPERGVLQAQDAVVRRLAERFAALLPARFGESFLDEGSLTERLRDRASGIEQALVLVRGCVQMTLRVFGEAEAPMQKAAEIEPVGGPGTRYLENRRREMERSRSLPEIEPLRAALEPLLRAERIERREAGRLLGTAYHLVPRERTDAYLATLEKAGGEVGGHRVSASGPWPPYAFGPEAA